MNRFTLLYALLAGALLAGCATTPPDIAGTGTQLEIRQAQTREYDTLDKAMTLRSAIATLQDLGFTIDQADADLGIVTGTKLDAYATRMTVTVVSREGGRVSVRANARIDDTPITQPETYQDFFIVLDKAMFLTSQSVD